MPLIQRSLRDAIDLRWGRRQSAVPRTARVAWQAICKIAERAPKPPGYFLQKEMRLVCFCAKDFSFLEEIFYGLLSILEEHA